ncbi:hypothetical protein UFOVP1451_15 [uncultured Caudovirales phage]|uniref:Uncharacterized protein n=1 Tax=uncultured Caudovirales phage TaxID=2100421 RepID=A0A6J5SGX5_9CAUD|nr:hypothetical protein UFOVP1451_15 [uncultured Caudovirales phage]
MLFDHKESLHSNCCEAHFRAAYTLNPPPFQLFSGARKFEYVFLVADASEARSLAISLHIPKEHFKYCRSEEELAGMRLPTHKQLFISQHLNTLDNRLHRRFHRIVRPDLSIVKPHSKPYPKYSV